MGYSSCLQVGEGSHSVLQDRDYFGELGRGVLRPLACFLSFIHSYKIANIACVQTANIQRLFSFYV